MPLINYPGAFNIKGKILIQYYSRHFQIPGEIESKTWIQDAELVNFDGHKNGLKKTFIIKFKDFLGREVKIYLSTKEIYICNQGENFKDDSQSTVIENEILWDDKSLFIIGEFHLENQDPNIIESYKYFITIDFNDMKKELLNFLSKERKNESLAGDFKIPL